MARQDEGAAVFSATTTASMQRSIAGTDRYTLIAVYIDQNTTDQVDTITYGGITVYELGVDEAARIAGPTNASLGRFEMFEVFDENHPANGTVTIEVTMTNAVIGLTLAAQWDGADQVDGHRGTAAVTTALNLEGDAWDLSPAAESVDQETVGFVFSSRTANDHTADADNPELFNDIKDTAGANAAVGTIVADTTSRTTLGGDWDDNRGYAAWGASILTAGAEPTPDAYVTVLIKPA